MGLGLSGLRLGLGQQLWGTVWSPANLFPTGTEEGLFLDFSDVSTLYTDQTFSTNISAIGDPVGGVIDKSGGSPFETVSDTEFSVPGDWTNPAEITVADGKLKYDPTISGVLIASNTAGVAFNAGDIVRVTFTISSITNRSGSVELRIKSSGAGGDISSVIFNSGTQGVGAYSRTFVPTTPGVLELRFYTASANADYLELDNFSGTVTPGNHLVQATSTARPIWTRHPKSGVRNLYNAGTITGGGDMVVAVDIADPVGGTSAFTLEAQSTSDGYFYASLPAGASLTNSVWLRRRSGSGTISMHTPGNIAQAVAVTSDWTRFSVSGSSPSGGASSAFIGVRIATLGDQVDVFGFQHETGSTATAYQTRVSQYDVTEAGVDDCYGLTFDGVDDYMVTAANLDLSGTTDITACAGVFAENDSKYFGVGMGAASTDVGFRLGYHNHVTQIRMSKFSTAGDIAAVFTSTGRPASAVLTGFESGADRTLRGNGAELAANTTLRVNSMGSGLLYLPSETTPRGAGTLYGVTLTDYILDAEQLAALETWTAARTPEVTLA